MRPPSTIVLGAAAASAVVTAAIAAYRYRRHRELEQQQLARLRGDVGAAHYADCPIVVVVDVGSSSIRASCFALVVVDAPVQDNGDEPRVVEWVLLRGSLQQLALDGTTAEALLDTHGEASMARVRAAVEGVIDRALTFLRAVGLAANVRGVGMSTFVMNLVGVDAHGTAVTPVYSYAGRRPATAAHARELRDELRRRGALDQCHDRTGTVVHPAYAPALLRRLVREEPETVARVAAWQSLSAALLRHWTARGAALPVSLTEAAWTGLLDVRRGVWYAPLVGLVGVDPRTLPPVQDSSEGIVGLGPAYARRWPELARVPFYLGIGDGAAANVGSKCTDPSRVAVTVGTSAAIRVVLPLGAIEHAKIPTGLWCYRLSRDRVLLGGALNDGGSVFQFFRQLLNVPAEEIDASLSARAPTQHGLCVLPFLSGERAPGWRDEATCALTGLNKWTAPLDVLQASMEAVAQRVALIFSLLSGYADSDATIVASGTALVASRAWRQMLADAMGRPLVLEASATEATSRGVAVLVGTYLGLHSLGATQELTGAGLEASAPRAAAHLAFLRARQEQELLYRRLYSDDW